MSADHTNTIDQDQLATDALALAQLIYDIYIEKKIQEADIE